MFRMIVKTQTADRKGREQTTTETIRHIPEAQLAGRRETARRTAPAGSTRTIKVVSEN